jgi:hypothetical protein
MIIEITSVYGSLANNVDFRSICTLEITANAITVNSEPSLTAKTSTIYIYNSFDVTFTIKSAGYITAADSIIVLMTDPKFVSLTSPTLIADTIKGKSNFEIIRLCGSLLY